MHTVTSFVHYTQQPPGNKQNIPASAATRFDTGECTPDMNLAPMESKQPSKTIGNGGITFACRDPSLQARLVMDQISRERGQQYQHSMVQAILGKQGESHVQVSESRPFWCKLKLPNIDGKHVHACHCDTINRQLGTLSMTGAFQAKSTKLPATNLAGRKLAGRQQSITKPPNSLPNCIPTSSSEGKVSARKSKDCKRQTRQSIHKTKIDVQSTPDVRGRTSDVGIEQSNETKKCPMMVKMLRSRTFDATVRKRTPVGIADIHRQASLQSRTRVLSNNHAENKIPIIQNSHTTNQNVSTKWKARSEIQPRGGHADEHLDTNMFPDSLELAREKSFEITFPGYDTRFVDLLEPVGNDEYRNLHLSDIDKKIDTRIHASSVEKCRRWLNKWVLPP
ncbi:uncharacterized protein [Asterias amurensis]|uniref:uncharacterized protein n=1 Tax=Asterias amurensis TaxID=7602 RepID=UPI003AB33026